MLANVGDLPYVVIIAVIVLVGGSQLPKIARNLGLAGKEFRKAQKEAEDEGQPEPSNDPRTEAMTPKPLGPASGGTAAEPAVTQNSGEGSITLSPAQLDALLKAREDQVRGEGTNN
jgi:TatA/E family protein of Tat protein translocase